MNEEDENEGSSRKRKSNTNHFDFHVEDLYHHVLLRPLPATHTMASSVLNRQPCPLIRDFLRSFGKDVDKLPDVSDLEASVDDQELMGVAIELDGNAIDNPRWSNLTKTQHARYLTLITSSQKLHQSQKKELQALKKQVKLERRSYIQAVSRFWLSSRDKLKCGFNIGSPSFPFVSLVTAADKTVQGWTNTLPQLRFGDSVQLISSEADSLFPSNCVDVTSSSRICTIPSNGETTQVPMLAELPSPGSCLSLPSQVDSYYKPALLQLDNTAMELAKGHKAEIITCIETLEALLQEPHERSSFFIPCSRTSSGTLVLEPPVPHGFSSPRQCLTVAYQEGIFQWLESIATKQSGGSKHYEYRILKLPHFRNKVCNVIVRIPNRVIFQNGDEVEQSLLVRSHIEYFPERGDEVPGTLEKSLWILDHILGMPSPSNAKRKVVVASIDPFAGKLLSWRDVSLAHALAEDDIAVDQMKSPLQNVRNLLCLLHSLTSLGRGNQLLCYPNRASGKIPGWQPMTGENRKFESISVHKAEGDEIDLADLLRNTGNVASSAMALERCCRFWRWTKENQIPYTFPIDSMDSSKTTDVT